MNQTHFGIAELRLRLRNCQTLKDKRQVIQGLIQKFRNLGFSVTEVDYIENPKFATLGLAFVGRSVPVIQQAFDESAKHLWGDFEVLGKQKEIVRLSEGISKLEEE